MTGTLTGVVTGVEPLPIVTTGPVPICTPMPPTPTVVWDAPAAAAGPIARTAMAPAASVARTKNA